MLRLVGREDDFWRQDGLGKRMAREWGSGTLDYEMENAAWRLTTAQTGKKITPKPYPQ